MARIAHGPTTRSIRTTCTRDCPDACSIVALVDQDRIVGLRGDPDHPVTKGFLCYRTSKYLSSHQYASERLLRPRAKAAWLEAQGVAVTAAPDGHGFVEVDWEVVLDLIAHQLLTIREQSGPAAIAHYRGGGSLGLLKHLTDAVFEHLGPCATKRGDICSGAGEAAQLADFGVSDSHDLADLAHARQIVLWGKNPAVSNVHLLPFLKDAKRRGANIALIDPVHHRGARTATLIIQPRPGGDFALAMAVAQLLDERGGWCKQALRRCNNVEAFRHLVYRKSCANWLAEADVPKDQAGQLAAMFATGPCTTFVGWGMQRRHNGAAIIRALSALGAVSGNLGIAGGGVSFYFKRRRGFDTSFVAGPERAVRTFPEGQFGQAILGSANPAYRALWITCANPVVSLPDSHAVARAVETRELVVVTDTRMTDTAKRAHVVLPTTTMLEEHDVVGAYGHHYLGRVQPVVARPGTTRTDFEIAQMLAVRLGISEAVCGTEAEWQQRILGPMAVHGVDLATLNSAYVRNPLSPKRLFEDGTFDTPSGRVELIAVAPTSDSSTGVDADTYPLWLCSNSHQGSQCSQWVESPRAPLEATVHPETAKACYVAPGELAQLRSPLGRLTVRVCVDAKQRCDVVIVPKGGSYDTGHCVNALIPATLTDLGEGVAYQDARVRLEPLVRNVGG